MITKSIRLAFIPVALFPCFLVLALMSGCGDDGTMKPMALTEENKANIAAEQAADAAADAAKNTKAGKAAP